MLPADTARSAILGAPLNPGKQPSPSGVVAAFDQMQAMVLAQSTGIMVKSTLSALNGVASAAAGIGAWVLGDATASNNGVYENTGTSGSPVWTRRGDLPYGTIKALNVGAGTPNAIVATSAIPVPSADGAALIILPIVATNDASPVTVAINGGATLTIKSNAGNDIAIGGLQEDMVVLGLKQGSTLRLISDQVSAAIIAQVEAMMIATEGYRDEAETFKNAAEAAAAAAAQKFFPVRALADADVDLSAPGASIDDVAMQGGESFIAAGQTDGAENGVYVWNGAASAATRHPNFDAFDDLPGAYFSVMEGTEYEDTLWRVTSDAGGTLGTTDIVIEEFAGGGGASGEIGEAADLTALRAIDTGTITTAILTDSLRHGQFVWDASDLSSTLLGADISSSAVDAGTETITSAAHGLATGTPVVTTTAVNGLALNTVYYAIRVDADDFRLASSFANALAGAAFNLTGTTAVTVKRHHDALAGVYVTPTADISGASGAWVRQYDGRVFAGWFGASGGGANDTAAVRAALEFAADNNRTFEFDGLFTVTKVALDGKAGMHWTGRGGLVGEAPLSIVSLVSSGTIATATVASTAGLATGNGVRIVGANEGFYNGLHTITVTSGTTFTYDMGTTETSPATGTIKCGIWRDAILDMKNCSGLHMDGDISLNGSGNPGYDSAFKLWSDGVASANYNTRIAFSAIVNVRLAYQIGDPNYTDLAISENRIVGGYLFNVARGVHAIGTQTVILVSDFICSVSNTNHADITPINYRATGATIRVTGGEHLHAQQTAGQVLLIEPLASGVYGNQYGKIYIQNAVIEWASALANSANPAILGSLVGGAIHISGCAGAHTQDNAVCIEMDGGFNGDIYVRGNEFFYTGGTRTKNNVQVAGESTADIYADDASFRDGFVQGTGGFVNGDLHYLG